MSRTPIRATVLYQEKVTSLPQAAMDGDDLWLSLADLETSSGWVLKPEGICKDEVCVPLPEERRSRFLRDDNGASWFNLGEFARLIEQPYAHDTTHEAWYFGAPGWEWKGRLSSPLAPDFTLPDLQGEPYSLSDFRGKKVLLALWASW